MSLKIPHLLHGVSGQVLLIFRSGFNQILVEFFDHFLPLKFYCPNSMSVHRRWKWSKIPTRTWSKSDWKMSRTWRLSLYDRGTLQGMHASWEIGIFNPVQATNFCGKKNYVKWLFIELNKFCHILKTKEDRATYARNT